MSTEGEGDGTRQCTGRALQPIGAARIFLVGNTQWMVEEVLDPSARTRSLIFTTHGLARRVRTYPANWRRLSESDLIELKEHV